MNFGLTEEQKAIKRMARDFAEKEVIPFAEVREKEKCFHRDLIKRMGEIGLFSCLFPEEYGGSNTGFLSQVLIMEELSRASVETSLPFNAQAVNVPMAIFKYGTEKQKKEYIPKLISGDIIGAFSLTEPDCGSDSAAIQTRAVKEGDSYIINGTKMWTTYGTEADVILLFAKTKPEAKHKGISAFLVDTKGLKGLLRKKIPSQIGTNCVPSAEIVFDHCRIPSSALLGGENEGFKIAMNVLHYGRVCVPARALGIAQACLEASIDYALQRKAFGKTIGEFQAIQHTIAEMTCLIEASRMLIYKAAWLADQNEPFGKAASIAKYFTGEAVIKVAEKAMEIHGGYGLAEEYPIHRYFMVARVFRTGEGSPNIQKNLLGMDELGLKKIDRHYGE